MKKLVCLLCAFVLAFSVMPMLVFAESDGITFDDNSVFPVSKIYEEEPFSFEAVISIPKGAGRAGVILGNYAGSAACVNFEITTNGRPRLYVVEYTRGETWLLLQAVTGYEIFTGEKPDLEKMTACL